MFYMQSLPWKFPPFMKTRSLLNSTVMGFTD